MPNITCLGCRKALRVKNDREGNVIACPFCKQKNLIPIASGAMPKSAPALGEQFYVTHCTSADSVLNTPGYSVRAASTSEREALHLAIEFPPYELPIDMWKDRPAKANTPRRLSCTRHPSGGMWVAHSVFLEVDTMGRDRSFFTHLLHLPVTTMPATILRSWDAVEWTKDYPAKADKKLPLGRLPVGAAISDNALTEFLSESQTGPTDLAVAVCPDRIRARTSTRRELVRRFLLGVILAKRENIDRNRLFVCAEPGLVAMLTYAAARILPPALMTNFTFSTFEPAHRGLRDYNLATVIGTYLGDAISGGLDPDLVTSRGYVLDTMRPELSSRELFEPLPAGLSELLDLAKSGEWSLLADVRRRIGHEDDALNRVSKLIARLQAAKTPLVNPPSVADSAVNKPVVKSSNVTTPILPASPLPRTPSISTASVGTTARPSILIPSILVPPRSPSISSSLQPSPRSATSKSVGSKRFLLVIACALTVLLMMGISFYLGRTLQTDPESTDETVP